jgi:hypothetical protein
MFSDLYPACCSICIPPLAPYRPLSLVSLVLSGHHTPRLDHHHRYPLCPPPHLPCSCTIRPGGWPNRKIDNHCLSFLAVFRIGCEWRLDRAISGYLLGGFATIIFRGQQHSICANHGINNNQTSQIKSKRSKRQVEPIKLPQPGSNKLV